MSDLTIELERAFHSSRHDVYERDLFKRSRDELERLTARVDELERTFKHHHVANPESGDACIQCGLDLRDPIHIRMSKSWR